MISLLRNLMASQKFAKNVANCVGESNLKSFNVIGFDLDLTLAQYKIPSLVDFTYSRQVNFLIEERGYPGSLAKLHVEEHAPYLARGFMLDIAKGILVQLDQHGAVKCGLRFGELMTPDQVKRVYGEAMIPDFYERHLKDNFRNNEVVRIFDDFFTVQCVPILNEIFRLCGQGVIQKRPSEIWDDVLRSLIFMYRDGGEQSYFTQANESIADFIHTNHPSLLTKLQRLKNDGKILFILTSSEQDYAEKVLNHIFGDMSWEAVFDFILYDGQKPRFFTGEQPFLTCEEVPATTTEPNKGKKYSQGCYPIFTKWLERLVEKPYVLYFGDSLTSDVYPISSRTNWKVCGIAHELCSDFHYGKNCHWESCMTCPDGSHSLWYHNFSSRSEMLGKNLIDILEEL